MVLSVIVAGIGNICLRKGMLEIGALETADPVLLFHYFTAAFANPWILLGVLLELAYFALWLAVLSWSDISWALPMNALEYIFVAATAPFLLGEEIHFNRWIGIGLISAGVVFMMRSWKTTVPEIEKEIGDILAE